MEGLDINIVWFLLLGILLTGYAILDGFDLGVGALHLFTKTDEERRIMLNSIGPVWDGNEVWLVTAGGAMFAAFPEVYATVFSGFYTAFMLLLVVLVFRAVAIEFRSKQPMGWWRRAWDRAFCFSSIFIAFLMGVSLGNIVFGIAIGADKEFAGSFTDLLNPYAILVGITTVALFMMHGAIYVVMKTEGEFQGKIKSWINNSIIFFVVFYVITTMATLIYVPHMEEPFKANPAVFVIALISMLSIANIPREISKQKYFLAFVSSSMSIASLMMLVGVGLFPNLVVSSLNPEFSLTVYNSASSDKTLWIMFIIAMIGIPFVLTYTTVVYWIFRGKVRIDKHSY